MYVSYLVPKPMSTIFTVECNKLWVLMLIFDVADLTFFNLPRVSRVIILSFETTSSVSKIYDV
jgi:hypothetical protein